MRQSPPSHSPRVMCLDIHKHIRLYKLNQKFKYLNQIFIIKQSQMLAVRQSPLHTLRVQCVKIFINILDKMNLNRRVEASRSERRYNPYIVCKAS